jgi:exodeoxyribonuclease VII large subunit
LSSSLYYQIDNNKIVLRGNTFSIKEQIKQLGGKWNSAEKHWWVDNNQESITSIQALGFLSSQSDSVSTTKLAMSSLKNEVSTNNNSVNVCFKISEFIQIITQVIKTSLGDSYWIYGEISSFKLANGHMFFDLIEKDESLINPSSSMRAASISCILWAGKKKFLQEKLNDIPFADGTQVKIKINIDVRKEGSRIVAIVEDVDTDHTKGNLLLQRLSIVQELKKRNLYHKNKLNNLKFLPIKIALITAENSRAASDFLDELKISQIAFDVSLFDCNMQGEKTSENIVSAFKSIANLTSTHFDCVVITRGGGSRLDLRWFDDLEIAKQIAYCPLPVITAVGHFEDVSIADEVSFQSEKTPTAAARFLINRVQDSFNQLFSRIDNLGRVLLKRFEKERQKLNFIEQKILINSERRFQAEKKNLEKMYQFINIFKSSIDNTMQRGFSLVYDENGNIVTGKNFVDNTELSQEFPKKLTIEFLHENKKQKILVDVQVNKVKLL